MQLIDPNAMTQILSLDDTIRSSRALIADAEAKDAATMKALVTARAMAEIRRQLTPELMRDVMALAGSPMGFRTDRDTKPENQRYSMETIRDCLIVALLRGLRVVGNEINIIASQLYVTKEGLRRLVREWPGVTDLRMTFGVPKLSKEGRGALVPCTAKWKRHGVSDEIVCEGDAPIPVRVNEAMGTDAILGKAESKLYRRIYARLSGSDISTEEDIGDGTVEMSTPIDSHTVDERVTVDQPEPLTDSERQSLIDACGKLLTAADADAWAVTMQQALPEAGDEIAVIARLHKDKLGAAAEAERIVCETHIAFTGCKDLGQLSRARRSLVSSYPDYSEQIHGMYESARETLKSAHPEAVEA